MEKSPIDDLFFEIYGHYPTKAGQAYELLVAATLAITTGTPIPYDQHISGEYSETDYQIDGIVQSDSNIRMVEAKDYTLGDQKVGRSDLQKMQGALTDLPFEGGLFASATDFTRPAKMYSKSTEVNPHQKPVKLFHIRPSTELDEKGRLNKIVVTMTAYLPDYSKGEFQCVWTKAAVEKFKSSGYEESAVSLMIDTFYTENGKVDTPLEEFTYDNQPGYTMGEPYAEGSWLLRGKYIKVNGDLFPLHAMTYKIPYHASVRTFTIQKDGTTKMLVKADDGSTDKLVTDDELRKVTFRDGMVHPPRRL